MTPGTLDCSTYYFYAGQQVIDSGGDAGGYEYVYSIRGANAVILRDLIGYFGGGRVYYLTDANANVIALVSGWARKRGHH